MNHLWLRNRQNQQPVNLRLLRQLAECSLQWLEVSQYELAVCLVGPRAMARLNEAFLGHEGPTDVLTFPYDSKGPAVCGEIVVCPQVACLQARAYRTTWQAELSRYVIHGLLHLTGYDDKNAKARRRMKRREDSLMRRLSRRFSLKELGGDS